MKPLERKKIPINDRSTAQVPMLPNFIRVEVRGQLETMMPLAAFTKAELRAIAEEWAEELVSRGMEQ